MKPPLGFRKEPLRLLAIVVGAAVLALASQAEIPIEPVPFTLQSLAVILAGMLLGWRVGMLTVLVWLAAGAAGLPVFSGGAGGWERFAGPTGGYLAAFPVAAAVSGWLAERGWNARHPLMALAAALIGHALCLLPGALWLATFVGRDDALRDGLLPFLPGALLKSIIAVTVLMLFARRR